jgi:hypothetical protein
MTITVRSISPPSSAPVGQVPDLPAHPPAESRLVPSGCILCDHDDAEPVAVGKDFTDPTSSETFLAVSCRTCGLVYLNPSPPPRPWGGILRGTPGPEGQASWGTDDWKTGPTVAREIARFARRLPDHGRLLDLGCGEEQRLDIAQRYFGPNWQVDTRCLVHYDRVEELNLPEAAYDGVLLIGVVELANNPLATLRGVKTLLRPGGLALMATPNTGSTVCRVFRGRHWSGYSFPRHPNLFDGKSLERAAELAGLELVSIGTGPTASVWVESARNLMADWGAPAWALARLSHASIAARAAARAIEWSQQIQSKGGLLLATLRRPEP